MIKIKHNWITRQQISKCSCLILSGGKTPVSDKHSLNWYNDACEADDPDDDESIYVDSDDLIVSTINII